MSAQIKDGGPAFPVESATWQGCGMTLRDYFAAKAMASMVMTIFTDDGYEPGSLTFFAVSAAFCGAALGILFARYKGWI